MKVSAAIFIQICMIDHVHAFSATTRAVTSSQLSLIHSGRSLNKGKINSSPSTSTQLYSSTTSSSSSSNSEPLIEPIGKGIARDYKARLPLYKSDITDGLNVQCLAATLFLFFACLAPAVGFGGLFATATGGAIGTIEMVSSTAGKMKFLFWIMI